MPQTITESTWGESDGQMQVDREAGVIRGVKCLGRESKNGRTYTDQALQDAARFYEGIGVNLDHPLPDQAHIERRIAEGFGVLRSARVEKSGVYANLHYLKEHALAGVITERAERMPRNFGLSHNATGSVREDDKGVLIVEGLQAVESVDIVSRPATTEGIFESEEHKPVPFFKRKPKPKHTVRSVLEEAKEDNEDVAQLLLLLEEEAFVAAADNVLDVDQESSLDERFKAAVAKLVMAFIESPKLTIEQVRNILTGNQENTVSDGKSNDSEKKVAESIEKLAVTMESLQSRLDERDRQDAIRGLLEEHGLAGRDLQPYQRNALTAENDADKRQDLLESFGIQASGNNRPRPAIGSARLQENRDDNKTADQLLEEVFPKGG